MTHTLYRLLCRALPGLVVLSAACGSGSASSETALVPVYNQETGRLEQLLSDRDGDGKPETRAFMDGAVLKRIEIDRNGDGAVDRWEYYTGGPSPSERAAAPAATIDHAEEANGPDQRITRREYFANGVIRRAVDDTDADGRPDKWETYEGGTLTRLDLDLLGKGFPSQRLTYGAGGAVVRVETDPDGDGVFVLVPPREDGQD